MINRTKKALTVAMTSLTVAAGSAQAAVPTEVTDGFTTMTTDFATILTAMVGLAVAVKLGFVMVKWIKRAFGAAS